MQPGSRSAGSTAPGSRVEVKVEALAPADLASITLADGVHEVKDAELVQFAIGESNSPITPAKVYPSLRYTDAKTGRTVWTPLSAILGFSQDVPNRI